MLTTCPGLHSTAERSGFEAATYGSQVQRPNHSATEPHIPTVYLQEIRPITAGTYVHLRVMNVYQ